MNSLIDFDAIGDVIINLTNRLSEGVGWIANRETPQKAAIHTYIEEIQKSDQPPLIKAALISNAKKTIREYCNQNNIVQIAMGSLEERAKPEMLGEDWLAQFMDKARLVSSEEFQLIWGKILARECNEPGSIPQVLLHMLEQMDKEDAETFSALCRITVYLEEEGAPIVHYSKFKEYNQFGITFDRLVNLKALGLIETSLDHVSHGYIFSPKKLPAKAVYFDKEYMICKEELLGAGDVIYTKPGLALCKSIEVEEIDGFWENYCLPLWKKNTPS